ncbi:MAG: ester cyclase [Pseudomonadota bacterium]
MSVDQHTANKALIAPWREALYHDPAGSSREALADIAPPDLVARWAEPWGTLSGPEDFFEQTIGGLLTAMPDLERRDTIVVAGRDDFGADWVGCGGFYLGTFAAPLFDIPPAGHVAHLRFHEFYRIAEGKVVEIQALWDLPELMMQAGAWPLSPSLGREWHVPGPATQDGLVQGPWNEEESQASRKHIVDMLTALKRHPLEGGPEVMEMERYWHPKMNWYGPSGIGTGRGVTGFRNWHQIPFLKAMPDRGQYLDEITYHFFGDGPYVAVTGWPNMVQTITDDGWLGIAPTGKRITMRSLDFWRLEKGLIRENWVMVDLMDVYAQIGVDVLGRMREFNKSRAGFDRETGQALEGAWQ